MRCRVLYRVQVGYVGPALVRICGVLVILPNLYDAFDIASVLQAHGFHGALICMYHVAAHPKMIAAELAMVAPKLDIKLVQTDHFDKTVLSYAMSIMRS